MQLSDMQSESLIDFLISLFCLGYCEHSSAPPAIWKQLLMVECAMTMVYAWCCQMIFVN